jgi:hypothetical protein
MATAAAGSITTLLIRPSPAEMAPEKEPTLLLNAFTVDVEDYYQVSAFEKHVRRDEWDQWESRVVANTHRMLALLARHGV